MQRDHFAGNDPFENMRNKHKEYLEKYGWVAHYVIEDSAYPNGINYHTHGLVENYHHSDLQICLPLRQEHAHAIFEAAIERIKEGFVFRAGQSYNNILGGGFAISFMEVETDGLALLRMLLPDANGGYESPSYKEQLEIAPNNRGKAN